eukprot:488189-Hanusia_phi.AAC.2
MRLEKERRGGEGGKGGEGGGEGGRRGGREGGEEGGRRGRGIREGVSHLLHSSCYTNPDDTLLLLSRNHRPTFPRRIARNEF